LWSSGCGNYCDKFLCARLLVKNQPVWSVAANLVGLIDAKSQIVFRRESRRENFTGCAEGVVDIWF
jgi:hypothetical protein